MSQQLYSRRLVAMFDVLGFANQVADPLSLQQTMQRYKVILKRANETAFSPVAVSGSPEPAPRNFEVIDVVFDTIILVSYPIDPHSVTNFIFGSITLLELFFGQRMPLRGAIALGDTCVESDPHLVVSNKFKELSILSECTDWSGAIITSDAAAVIVPNLLGDDYESSPLQMRSAPLHRFQPSWKNANRLDKLLCLNWYHMLSSSNFAAGMNFLADNEKKLDGTKRYVDWVRSLPDDTQLLDDNFSPARRLRLMKARAGARIGFFDAEDLNVNPGREVTVCFQ